MITVYTDIYNMRIELEKMKKPMKPKKRKKRMIPLKTKKREKMVHRSQS